MLNFFDKHLSKFVIGISIAIVIVFSIYAMVGVRLMVEEVELFKTSVVADCNSKIESNTLIPMTDNEGKIQQVKVKDFAVILYNQFNEFASTTNEKLR